MVPAVDADHPCHSAWGADHVAAVTGQASAVSTAQVRRRSPTGAPRGPVFTVREFSVKDGDTGQKIAAKGLPSDFAIRNGQQATLVFRHFSKKSQRLVAARNNASGDYYLLPPQRPTALAVLLWLALGWIGFWVTTLILSFEKRPGLVVSFLIIWMTAGIWFFAHGRAYRARLQQAVAAGPTTWRYWWTGRRLATGATRAFPGRACVAGGFSSQKDGETPLIATETAVSRAEGASALTPPGGRRFLLLPFAAVWRRTQVMVLLGGVVLLVATGLTYLEHHQFESAFVVLGVILLALAIPLRLGGRRHYVEVEAEGLRISGLFRSTLVPFDAIRQVRVQPLQMIFEVAARRDRMDRSLRPFRLTPTCLARLSLDQATVQLLGRLLGRGTAIDHDLLFIVADAQELEKSLRERVRRQR